MKKLLKLLICLSVFTGIQAEEVETKVKTVSNSENLEKELDKLNMDVNQGPAEASIERLYSVQTRLSPLTKRHEITLDMGRNLNSGGHLVSNQIGASYRFHTSDRLSFGLAGKKVFNKLDSGSESLLSQERIVLNKDYVKSQGEIFGSLNVFYGKFRLGLNRVFYFDQYVRLGAGVASLRSGSAPMLSPDLGIALWLAKKGSIRFGLRNEIYNEQRISGKEMNHNLIGYLNIGYLFGN